jgi:hypothetical protein
MPEVRSTRRAQFHARSIGGAAHAVGAAGEVRRACDLGVTVGGTPPVR